MSFSSRGARPLSGPSFRSAGGHQLPQSERSLRAGFFDDRPVLRQRPLSPPSPFSSVEAPLYKLCKPELHYNQDQPHHIQQYYSQQRQQSSEQRPASYAPDGYERQLLPEQRASHTFDAYGRAQLESADDSNYDNLDHSNYDSLKNLRSGHFSEPSSLHRPMHFPKTPPLLSHPLYRSTYLSQTTPLSQKPEHSLQYSGQQQLSEYSSSSSYLHQLSRQASPELEHQPHQQVHHQLHRQQQHKQTRPQQLQQPQHQQLQHQQQPQSHHIQQQHQQFHETSFRREFDENYDFSQSHAFNFFDINPIAKSSVPLPPSRLPVSSGLPASSTLFSVPVSTDSFPSANSKKRPLPSPSSQTFFPSTPSCSSSSRTVSLFTRPKHKQPMNSSSFSSSISSFNNRAQRNRTGALPEPVRLPQRHEQSSCALSLHLLDLAHSLQREFEIRRDEYNDCFEKVLASAIEAFGMNEGSKAIQVFGSVKAGLATQDSDLDLQLLTTQGGYAQTAPKSVHKNDIPGRKKELEQLSVLYRRMRTRLNVIFIKTARVPIIKVLQPPCDVSVAREDNSLWGELFRAAASYDSRVAALILLVKHWAHYCLKGVLPNMSWTLLMIHYLQSCQPPVLPPLTLPLSPLPRRNASSLAALLWGFFEHYSLEDAFAQRVSVTQDSRFLPLLEAAAELGMQFAHPVHSHLLAFDQGLDSRTESLRRQCQLTLLARSQCEQAGELTDSFFLAEKVKISKVAVSAPQVAVSAPQVAVSAPQVIVSAPQRLICHVCNVQLPAAQVAEHEKGAKHRALFAQLRAAEGPLLSAEIQRPKIELVTSLPVKNSVQLPEQPTHTIIAPLRCELCGVKSTSERKFENHLRSPKHQAALVRSAKSTKKGKVRSRKKAKIKKLTSKKSSSVLPSQER